jgi:hypothetical protein
MNAVLFVPAVIIKTDQEDERKGFDGGGIREGEIGEGGYAGIYYSLT